MKLYTEVILFHSVGKKMNQKNQNGMGKNCFGWLLLPWWVSSLVPSYLTAPETEWALIGNLCKDSKWKHSFTGGHKACSGRKDPSLVSPSHFLVWDIESMKEVLASTDLKETEFRSKQRTKYAVQDWQVQHGLRGLRDVRGQLPVTWQTWGHVKCYKSLGAS